LTSISDGTWIQQNHPSKAAIQLFMMIRELIELNSEADFDSSASAIGNLMESPGKVLIASIP
jgi:hypothetical protein